MIFNTAPAKCSKIKCSATTSNTDFREVKLSKIQKSDPFLSQGWIS